MHRRFGTLVVTATLAFATLTSTASAQKTYENEVYGFKMLVPKDFRSVPINMAEKWVVAKFLYKRELEPKNAEFWISMTPEIQVIVFPKVDVKDVVRARKQKEKEFAIKGKDGKTKKVNLLEYLQNPFRSYQEYLRENYDKGGWFVAEEKEITINGLPCIRKKIEVDDKMRVGTKATVLAWEIDYGDAIYVVQFEVIKDYDHKFQRVLDGAAKSFKQTPRSQTLRPTLSGERSTEDKTEEAAAMLNKQLSPEERREAREKDLRLAIEKAKSSMADGWKSYKQGPFTVFHSTKIAFARKVSKQAMLMWKWMDKNFGYIGEDYSVGNILRICKDSAEAQAYSQTSSRSDYGMTAREIVVWDDRDWGWGDTGSGKLNAEIATQYLSDKNRRLWIGLPPWLDHGLVIYIGSLKMKGSKLVGKPDEWDMEAIRESLRKDEFRPAKDVLKATWESYNASRANSSDRIQSLAIVNFLFERGARHKKFKKILPDYIAFLDKRLLAFEKEWAEAFSGNSVKDAEEASKWASEWSSRRDKIYDECFEHVFGGWTNATWHAFDKAWRDAY